MKRRNFFKIASCSLFSLLGLPEKVKAKRTIDIPFIPTLKFLQEDNPEIIFFEVTHSSRGTWQGFAFRPNHGGPLGDGVARLFLENGEWIAVDQYTRNEEGKLGYIKQIQWPNWIRKF